MELKVGDMNAREREREAKNFTFLQFFNLAQIDQAGWSTGSRGSNGSIGWIGSNDRRGSRAGAGKI